jgi:hypothetical protein
MNYAIASSDNHSYSCSNRAEAPTRVRKVAGTWAGRSQSGLGYSAANVMREFRTNRESFVGIKIAHKNGAYIIPVKICPHEKAINKVSAVLKVSDMVDKIKSVFGLNAVQVAAVIGVSRPSLYNHIADKELPVSIQPYQDAYDLAMKVNTIVCVSLKPGIKSVLVDGKTLLAHLKDKNRSEDRILHVAQEVSKKILLTNKPVLSAKQQRATSHRVSKVG